MVGTVGSEPDPPAAPRALNAAPRQENVYFSSSDGDFPDRCAAEAGFERLRDGRVAVKGGWRLYSSGPGLFRHKVRAMLFGVRERYDKVIFDRKVPVALRPCRLEFEHEQREVEREVRHGPQYACFMNDCALSGSRPANPYRGTGIAIDRRVYRSSLREGGNRVRIVSPSP